MLVIHELREFHDLIRDSGMEDYAGTIYLVEAVKGDLRKACSLCGVLKWIGEHALRLKLVNDEEV